jgi:catechol 2,3-dioxygenase-like lactoylglutathione lyase family enzyme
MNITSFGQAGIRSRDLAASERFYAGVLNMPLLTREPAGGSLAFRVGASNRFIVKLRSPDEWPDETDHIAFVIGNNPAALEAVAKRLEEHQVVYERHEHEEFESLCCRDPDGRLVELYYWPSW